MTRNTRASIKLTLLILALAVGAAAQGCGGIKLPFSLGGDNSPPVTQAATAATNSLLGMFAGLSFLIGVGSLIASFWLPILQPFRRMAAAMILLGVTLAVLPFLLNVAETPIRWGIYMALLCGGAWLAALTYTKVAAMIRISRMTHELRNGSTPEQKPKLAAGIAALTRSINPKVDKAFKTGKETTESLMAKVAA